jgi:Ankyrin repeat
LQLILDLGESFIDLEEKSKWGNSPLLLLAHNYSGGYDPERFALLLRRGSNIHARNSYTGDTCLHICIESARYCEYFKELESLILLVKNGADVNACNYDGASVSEYAYWSSEDDDEDNRWLIGGYRGDLWDAVLSECGYDITEMRKGFPRRPRYTKNYTREHFEGLWRGREEFCPYYHDPTVWDPEGVEDQESFEEHNSLRDRETADDGGLFDDWGSLRVSTMEPASPWQHSASPSQMMTIHRGHFDQEHIHSSISGFIPTTWQDWPAATQITNPEHDLQAEFRSGVFKLEPNPWL